MNTSVAASVASFRHNKHNRRNPHSSLPSEKAAIMKTLETPAVFILALRRERSGWAASYTNPQGGGGNAMTYSRSSKTGALAAALRMVTEHAAFVVTIDKQEITHGIKRGTCKHNSDARGCFLCIQAEASVVLRSAPTQVRKR